MSASADQLHELQRQIRGSGDAAVAGLWHLLWPEVPGSARSAVAALEEAARREGDDAGILSDLSAAYLVRAQAEDRPSDLVLALDVVDRSLELRPGLAEALFNRALILEKLGLAQAAAEAWSRYLEVDSQPGWREEAEERLRSLSAIGGKGRREAYKAALATGERGVASAAVTLDPGAIREFAIDELLPQWAEEHLAGARGADRLLDVIEETGLELAATSGDRTVSGAVESIRRAAREDASAVNRLALAHRSFRRGRELFARSSYREAEQHLEAAKGAFQVLENPLAWWAEFWLAASASTANDYQGALQGIDRIRAAADLEALPALAARLHWVQGLIEARTGFSSESLDSFRSAAAIFDGMGETTLEAGAIALSAESCALLGQDEEAWRQRVRAFPKLGSEPTGYLHNLLIDAAAAARNAGSFHAAVSLQSAGVANAQALGSVSRIVEAQLWRSKIWTAAGRRTEAAADLDKAEAELETIEDPELKRRLLADLMEARGLHLATASPGRARRSLTEAIAAYRDIGYTARLPALYLHSARVALAEGDRKAAVADLEAGIREFERRDERLLGELFRYEHFEQAQDLFDEMIGLMIDEGRPRRALLYSERARLSSLRRVADAGRLLRGQPAASSYRAPELPDLDAAVRRLPPGTVLIEYAALPDRLVIWRVAGGGVRTWVRPISRQELTGRVESFHRALADGGSHQQIQRLGEDLHSDLFEQPGKGLTKGFDLLIVPDRALAGTAFAALPSSTRDGYLIEEFTISQAPGLLSSTARPGQPLDRFSQNSRLLLVGDPADGEPTRGSRLPGARREVEVIASAYPGALLLQGDEVSKDLVLDALADAVIFHYAGHGIHDRKNPWASYLPMVGMNNTSVRLPAHEIATIDAPNLRLVVLSACSSAGSAQERATPVSGLGGAFLEAGVEVVVGTLWDVQDGDTVDLLVDFHQRVSRGEQPHRALRSATLREIARSDNRTWASLVMIRRIL